MNDQEAVRILKGAAALIEEYGLCKGVVIDDNNSHCARGALYDAYSPGWASIINKFQDLDRAWEWTLDFESKYLIHLVPVLPGAADFVYGEKMRLPVWNNEPERTKEDVIELFEKAAQEVLDRIDSKVVTTKEPELVTI